MVAWAVKQVVTPLPQASQTRDNLAHIAKERMKMSGRIGDTNPKCE